MQPGDLVKYGARRSGALYLGCLGILLRKLQYEVDDDIGNNWDGEAAWWIQFIDDEGPLWTHEEDLILVSKGN